MMNVGLIFYAAKETRDDALWRVADSALFNHAALLVRGDGSTAHEGIFDLEDGRISASVDPPRLAERFELGSRASMGVIRFTTAYEFTDDDRFLRTAQQCADFFIDRTPPHGVPPNDWEQPAPKQIYESSAAAIAARGLFALSAGRDRGGDGKAYRAKAHRILTRCLVPSFWRIRPLVGKVSSSMGSIMNASSWESMKA